MIIAEKINQFERWKGIKNEKEKETSEDNDKNDRKT